MKVYPQYDAIVRSGWRTTVTLIARSRCGDPIRARATRVDEGEARAAALGKLDALDILSTIHCNRPGRHGHHG